MFVLCFCVFCALGGLSVYRCFWLSVFFFDDLLSLSYVDFFLWWFICVFFCFLFCGLFCFVCFFLLEVTTCVLVFIYCYSF